MALPNILWICTDQQRYDTIGALGNPSINTPALDRLCTNGVAFTRAYCQSPVCTPSRASFLTGLYPSRIHVTRNGNGTFPQDTRLITRRLADAGYECGLVGKLHLASAYSGREKRADDGYTYVQYSHGPLWGLGTGNDYLEWVIASGSHPDDILVKSADGQYLRYKDDVPVGLHDTTWCAERTMEFIGSARRPWLLSLNTFDPHAPFDAPRKYAERYDPAGLAPPLFRESDVTTQRRLADAFHKTRTPEQPGADAMARKASYYGMIELVDENIGRILDLLESTGQLTNTMVIFTSDHGEMLGDHGLVQKGCRFYEGAVRVPLIVSWPERMLRGVARDELVELTDIVPTICEIAGIGPLETDGRSLLPMLTDASPRPGHRSFVRSEYFDAISDRVGRRVIPAENPSMATMYMDGRFKLVAYHHLDLGELYDLHTDPDEFDNLWDDPRHASVRAELTEKSFNQTMLATDLGPPRTGPF